MRNFFLSLVFMLIGSFAFANNGHQTDGFKGTITINETAKNQKSEVVLIFNDLKSFNEFDAQQMNYLNENAGCTAPVEVEITVSVGSASATVKAEGVPCKELEKKIRELKKAALEVLK